MMLTQRRAKIKIIQTLKNSLKRLVLEDCFKGQDFPEILDKACQAKNHNGRYGGYSPMQWFHGRSHPLMDGTEVPPSLAEGSEFEHHLHRKTTAATAFLKAEATDRTIGLTTEFALSIGCK